MIEIQVTIDCEQCGEELYLSEDDMIEVANFGASMVRCWGIEKLPGGWAEQYGEIVCQNCKERRIGNST